MAGDFAVAGDGKNKKKGADLGCHLEELGLAGEAVGAEASAEVLAEVEEEAGLDGATPIFGDGLAMVCLMAIPIGDTDLATLTMAQSIPMVGTHGKNVC